DTIASYKENIETLKGKIKKAMYYPAIVIAVAILVSCILLMFVVPQFESVFKNFGADLPAFTQMLVSASRFMGSYWWMLLLILAGSQFALIVSFSWILLLLFAGSICALIVVYKRSQKVQRFVGRMLLKLPVVGAILR